MLRLILSWRLHSNLFSSFSVHFFSSWRRKRRSPWFAKESACWTRLWGHRTAVLASSIRKSLSASRSITIFFRSFLYLFWSSLCVCHHLKWRSMTLELCWSTPFSFYLDFHFRMNFLNISLLLLPKLSKMNHFGRRPGTLHRRQRIHLALSRRLADKKIHNTCPCVSIRISINVHFFHPAW